MKTKMRTHAQSVKSGNYITMKVVPGPRTNPTAREIKDMQAYIAALQALRGSNDSHQSMPVAPVLCERIKATRKKMQRTDGQQFSVCIYRKGKMVGYGASFSPQAALIAARQHMREQRKYNQKRDTRVRSDGRVNGVRLEGGWFLNQLKKKHRTLIDKSKRPQYGDSANYVGVEIECYVKCTRDELTDAFVAANLAPYVSLVSDGSIRNPSNTTPIEVRIMARETEYASIIVNVCEVIKACEGKVNRSCGLHVHLDGRHREHKDMYYKLVSASPLFLAMVPESRRNNEFCKVNKTRRWTKEESRYWVVNPNAYEKHKTIETRVHSGTVDPYKIINWVTLLTTIINGPKFQVFPTRLKTIRRNLGLSLHLTDYIASRLTQFATNGEHIPFLSHDTIKDDTGDVEPTSEDSEQPTTPRTPAPDYQIEAPFQGTMLPIFIQLSSGEWVQYV